jgi:hypothetical protein
MVGAAAVVTVRVIAPESSVSQWKKISPAARAVDVWACHPARSRRIHAGE